MEGVKKKIDCLTQVDQFQGYLPMPGDEPFLTQTHTWQFYVAAFFRLGRAVLRAQVTSESNPSPIVSDENAVVSEPLYKTGEHRYSNQKAPNPNEQ